jgi:y4mF family transcriptional regulator
MNRKYLIDDKNEAGQLIKILRKERKLTQQELADQAGLSFSFVNQVERGKKTVRLDALNKLLAVFGYTMQPTRISREHE